MTSPEPGRKYALEEAVAGALKAGRSDRIDWRNAIADHGSDGIDAVFEWLGDAELGFFAVRVIEEIGRRGAVERALDALASLRSLGASPNVRREAEAAIERLRPRAPKHATFRPQARVPSSGGIDWPGFQASEFASVDGTTWRRSADRRALIPLLLRPLQDLDSDMRAYAIYRLPEVHLANRDRYEQTGEHEQGWRASKLVVYAHGEKAGVGPHVAVGYYVEKGTGADQFGPVDRALWDWPRFVELLREETRRRVLEQAFSKHDLAIGDYTGGRFGPDGAAVGFVGHLENGEFVLRFHDGRLEHGWESLVNAVESLPQGEWHDLHVWREWSAEEAIAGGQRFAVSELLPVVMDLAAVYANVIRHVPAKKR